MWFRLGSAISTLPMDLSLLKLEPGLLKTQDSLAKIPLECCPKISTLHYFMGLMMINKWLETWAVVNLRRLNHLETTVKMALEKAKEPLAIQSIAWFMQLPFRVSSTRTESQVWKLTPQMIQTIKKHSPTSTLLIQQSLRSTWLNLLRSQYLPFMGLLFSLSFQMAILCS